MTAREMLERMAKAGHNTFNPTWSQASLDAMWEESYDGIHTYRGQNMCVIQAALRELVEQCEQDNIPHLTIGARIAYSVLAITELEL